MAWPRQVPGLSILISIAFAAQVHLLADAARLVLHNSFDEDGAFMAQDEDEHPEELRLLQLGLTLHRSVQRSVETSGNLTVDPSLPLQLKHQKLTSTDLEKAAEEYFKQQNPMISGMLRNADLEASLGADPTALDQAGAVPLNDAESISFVDEDPKRGLVKGTIHIQQASNQSDVTHYNVYWACNHTAIGSLLVALPKGVYYHHLHSESNPDDGVPLPQTANQLIVFTSNRAGMSTKGVTTDVFDWWQPPLGELLKHVVKPR
mmetsp:Transcript_87314/g.154767  ORF Transcript_87314/g.154767 Transcript_87314/m.154767 type:complete len:262 (+) Transcript_87314:69-854(+)|eukprot:CAMPEP_0197653838 /NCGR_PEP_ID=MMETSP1338-20131121/37347_1 /TAXON_ID=43686 ORGANISM="Pelagodinium beii, Strain RCC1491" /NCGR_SAMPLE_ID=MMETSP1338 /ASSEMBLY_ACC=CAM_ASM_000754 /LENGTH=261 /DNA_ID=CAMNT_0043229097 /DNA_START=38 /DNA_END=819 /DNA_ORIENTATION=-